MKLQWDEAQALSLEVLVKLGFTGDESAIITDHLLDATARGLEYAGLPRILVIADRIRKLGNDREPEKIVRQTPVSRLIDGGGNLGYICAHHAMQAVRGIAGAHGVGIVGVRECHPTGHLPDFSENAAPLGLVGAISRDSLSGLW